MKKILSFLTAILFAGSMMATDYQRVTSTADLVAGAKYVIGTEAGSFIATTSNTNNRKIATAEVTDGVVTATEAMMVFTLGGSADAWTFATDNYLGTAGYLNATSTTGSNYLKVVATLDDYAYFTIAIAEDSVTTITCNGKESRHIMYQNGTTCFACYNNQTSAQYSKPNLYKEVTGGGEPEGDPQTVYLNVNTEWYDNLGEKFAIYAFEDGKAEYWSPFLSLAKDETVIYKGEIPAGYTNLIFVRFGSASTEPGWDNSKLNQTADLKIQTNGNDMFVITGRAYGEGYWAKYTAGGSTEPEETVKLYYVKEDAWGDAINAYVWVGEDVYAAWPGTAMTKLTSSFDKPVYEISFPAKYTSIIFNDGTNQTNDMLWDAANPYYYAGKWYASLTDIKIDDDPVDPETPTLYDTLYFVNTLGWATPYGYYWPIEVSNWPGQELTKTEDKVGNYDVYMFVAPVEKISNCVFNDGASDNIKQTVDLAPKNNDKYFVPSNEQDNVGAYKGSWYATLDAITGEQLAAGFYLIGQKGWTVADLSEDLKFAETTTANVYSLAVTLAKDQEIKAVYVNDKGEIANWMPKDGDNFVVTDKYAGEKTVLLNVTGKGGEGWFEGYLYVEPNPDQPAAETLKAFPKDSVSFIGYAWGEDVAKNKAIFDANNYIMMLSQGNDLKINATIGLQIGNSSKPSAFVFRLGEEADLTVAIARNGSDMTAKLYYMGETTDTLTAANLATEGTLCASVDITADNAAGVLAKKKAAAGYYKVYGTLRFGCPYIIAAENGDTPEPPTPEETVTVYFYNNLGWESVNAFVWPAEGAAYKEWPGEAAKKEAEQINGKDVYAYTFPAKYVNIIFNNGTVQTADLKWDAEKPYFVPAGEKNGEGKYEGTWYAKADIPTGGDTPEETVTVYFYNNLVWENVNAFVWNNVDGAYKVWSGEAAKKEAEQINGVDVYSYTFPAKYTSVIFNNGTIQTVDLVWDAEKPYFVPNGTPDEYGKYDGKWYAKADIPAGGETPAADFTKPFVLKFNGTGESGKDASAAFTADVAAIFDAASAPYVASVETATKVYAGRPIADDNSSVKFGTTSAQGSLAFTLAQAIEVDSIIVNATQYGSNASKITVNGTEFALNAGNKVPQDCKITPEGKVYAISIAQSTTERLYLRNIRVYPKTSTPEPPTTTYYMKNNWEAGADWTWKEMTQDGEIYKLENVVFGGYGVNYNTAESDEGAAWVAVDDILGDEIAAKDTVTFVLDPVKATVTATLIGKYQDGGDTPEPPTPEEYVTLYFVNVDEWENVYAYVWNDAPEIGALAAWPGTKMTITEDSVGDYAVYSFTFATKYNKVIFDNGSGGAGNQTSDMIWNAATPYYYDGIWYASLDDINPAAETKFYISGDMSLVGAGSVWDPKAIKSLEDSYTLHLTPGVYLLKISLDGTEDTWKGYSDLSEITPGLTLWGANNAIAFTLAQEGDVVVTYKVVNEVVTFTVVGKFFTIESGYYLMSMNKTLVDFTEADKFAPNTGTEGEYMLNTTLTEGDNIAVVMVANNAIYRYYIGENFYYVDANHAGATTIYFRPEGNAEWTETGGYFYVVPTSTTGIEETIAAGKAAKVLRNGQILILKGDKMYNVMGAVIR